MTAHLASTPSQLSISLDQRLRQIASVNGSVHSAGAACADELLNIVNVDQDAIIKVLELNPNVRVNFRRSHFKILSDEVDCI